MHFSEMINFDSLNLSQNIVFVCKYLRRKSGYNLEHLSIINRKLMRKRGMTIYSKFVKILKV